MATAGIGIERIRPGNPQQNGQHERMHLTLKNEATKPPGKNFLQQQARFDQFIDYNQQRPHQAMEMQYPAELYTPSPRPYTGLPELHYPFHDMTITVTNAAACASAEDQSQWRVRGSECRRPRSRDHIWLISFMHYDLGFFDDETCRLRTAR